MKKVLAFLILLFFENISFAQLPPNDCVNSITVCGNGSFISNATGTGNFMEISSCGSIEHNTIWLKINVVQAGTLGFDLIPVETDINVDYDFWVFGPATPTSLNRTCSSLGPPIRCSTSNPLQSGSTSNHTGMNLTTNATTSVWNSCCGYVRSLDVRPNQIYYIAIDRPHGDGGFELNWSWTPTIPGSLPFSPPPIANRIPDYRMCSVTADVSVFNLNSVKSQINPDLINNTITFHATFANALDKVFPLSSIIGNNGNPQTIYARVTNNVTKCYSITDFKLAVLPIPTAALSVSNQQICIGETVVTTFTGSPDSKIEYTINGGIVQSAMLNSSGIFSLTQAVTTDTTFDLLNIRFLDSAGNTICSQSLNSSISVTVNALPTATISGTTTICSGTTTQISFNGTPEATVNYIDNLGNPQSVQLDLAGTNSITTPLLTANATYTLVNVISSGANPCTKTLTDFVTVTVNALPTATISGTTPICSGTTTQISFNGTPDATVNYLDNLGNPQSVQLDLAGTNSITTPALAANATFTLVNVISSGTNPCTKSLTDFVTVTVNSLPTATISGTTTICSGTTTQITFNGTPEATVNYLDNLGNAQSVQLDLAGTNSITTSALTANATFTLVNVISSGTNPCTETLTGFVIVTVNSLPTATIFVVSPICSGTTTQITFNGTPEATVNYLDNLGNAQSIQLDLAGINSITTSALIADATFTLVNVISSGANPCTKTLTDSVTITVNALPTATISGATTICSGTTTQITFNGTPEASVNYLDNLGNPQSIQLDLAGTKTITTTILSANATFTLVNVISSGANPCTKTLTDSVTITVNSLPTATISGATTICSGTTTQITFDGTPEATVNYLDNLGNPQSIQLDLTGTNSITTPSLTANATFTLVNVISSGVNSCTKTLTDFVTVSVNSLPTATISGSTTICSGTTTQISFNGTPEATVNYLDNLGNPQSIQLDLAGTNSITTPALTANATFTLVNVISSGTNPCTKSLTDFVTVTLNSLPTATISGTTTICSGATTQITFNGTPEATVNYLDNLGNPQSIQLDLAGTNSLTTSALTTNATFTLVNVISSGTNPCTKNLTDFVTVTVNSLPTATISVVSPICIGTTTQVTFNGTPGATVNYLDNLGNPQSILLDLAGTNSLTTAALTTNATFTLVNVISSGTNPCTKTLTDSVTVTVNALPTATISRATTICSGTTTQITFNGTPGATVNYLDNLGNSQSVLLDLSGTKTITTTILSANATFTLINVISSGINPCIKILNGSTTVIVNTIATASITALSPICFGTTSLLTFNGTPNAIVNYLDNLGNSQSIQLDSTGTNSVITPILTANATFTLVSVAFSGTNLCNQNLSGATTIIVTALPTATISGAATICNGAATLVTFNGTPNATITYTINGGSPLSLLLNGSGTNSVTTANLTSNTTYQLVSIMSSGLLSCSQSQFDSILISVTPIPLLNYNVASSNLCSGQTTDISLSSNVANATFSWTSTQLGVSGASLGIGNIISQNLTTLGTNPGTVTYSISVNVGSCQSSVSLAPITVNPIPVISSSSASQTICSGSSINIPLTSNVANSLFYWNVAQTNVLGGTNGIGAQISQNLTTIGNASGEAVYSVFPILNGCQGPTVSIIVDVNAIPVASANAVSKTICSGQLTNIIVTSSVAGTTFSWSVFQTGIIGCSSGNGNLINQELLTIGNTQGIATYIITPSLNGCYGAQIIVPITVNPTPEVFGSSSAIICSGEAPNISLFPSIAATTFAWTVSQINVSGAQVGTGNAISDILTATTNLGTAIYTVTPTANGCSGTPLSIAVTVNPAPAPQINDGIICVDKATNIAFQTYILDTQLSNTTYDFVWYLNGMIINGAVNNNYEADESGTYSVLVTNTATGCKSVLTNIIVSDSYPGLTIDTTQTLAFSDDATLEVVVTPPNTTYLYSIDNGPKQISNIFSNIEPGSHLVTVTDLNGCTNLIKQINSIGFPTYFTPNGDGIHDSWNIVGLDATAKVFIFDRYGKLIKQISPIGEGWDGTFNGQPLSATDYWFTVDYTEDYPTIGTSKVFKAHFSLKR
jgi:gliding motility-associated-like protein